MLNKMCDYAFFALHFTLEPKTEAIDRKAGEAIKQFKDVVFPDDYDPLGKPAATKRKVKNGSTKAGHLQGYKHYIAVLVRVRRLSKQDL